MYVLVDGSYLFPLIIIPKYYCRVRMEWLQLSKACTAVICCRVSPLQKAEVVRCVCDCLSFSLFGLTLLSKWFDLDNFELFKMFQPGRIVWLKQLAMLTVSILRFLL